MTKKKRSDEELLDERKVEIHRKLSQVQAKQDKVNETLENLQSFNEKHTHASKSKNKSRNILLHETVLKACESQCDYIRKMLSEIEKIRAAEYKIKMKSEMKRHALMQLITLQGNSLPLWVNDKESFPPAYVGAIPPVDGIPLKPGDAVAAYSNKNWMLAEIVSSSRENYEVRDVDEDPQKKANIVFPRHRLIPLPKYRAHPTYDSHALFPLEALVYALYPQTTCFYKGIVQRVPTTPVEDYQVAFEDASYSSGFSPAMNIPQRYVVAYKDVKSLTKKRRERRDEMDSD